MKVFERTCPWMTLDGLNLTNRHCDLGARVVQQQMRGVLRTATVGYTGPFVSNWEYGRRNGLDRAKVMR